MTLPFRRRHHDDEAGHDRARSLVSREMLEPIGTDDSTWLQRHLEACAECRRDQDGFLADRDLLRSLRDATPEPPRDLWARTSAAIEREARARGRRDALRPASESGSVRRRALPFGAAAGALVVLVVVGTAIIPPTPPTGPVGTPGGSAVGNITPVPQPTNINVDAGDVAWIQPDVDGNWKLYISDVDEVCPRSKPGCNALGANQPGRAVDLGDAPTGVTISPTADQLVLESPGDGTSPGKVVVVALPDSNGQPTPAPPSPTVETPTTEPSIVVVSPDPASPEPTPDSSPAGGVTIASGVTMVGEAAYSADGEWLAFSARPSDDSTGPDLYLWRVGDAAAVAVTSDHQTYFSAWHAGRVLASRIESSAPPSPDPSAPTASGEPATSEPPSATANPDQSGEPAASASPAAPVESHPVSFLLDPATGVITDLARPDVWLPVVDPTGRFTAYWSGTVVPTPDGLDWQLGTGQLVLDRWSETVFTPEPPASADPAASPADPASPDVSPVAPAVEPSTSPEVPVGQLGPGPAGDQVPLVTGPTVGFVAKFDPAGLRLALWVGEDAGREVGRLHLLVIDPETGAIDTRHAPLPGTPALRRFSMDTGRLAWVNPRGQDGQESTVQVLGWSKNDFGEIRTIPARDLFIVR